MCSCTHGLGKQCASIKPDEQRLVWVQFEDPSDARLSDEEARRKIMQRTLTGATLCAHLACMYFCWVHWLPCMPPVEPHTWLH